MSTSANNKDYSMKNLVLATSNNISNVVLDAIIHFSPVQVQGDVVTFVLDENNIKTLKKCVKNSLAGVLDIVQIDDIERFKNRLLSLQDLAHNITLDLDQISFAVAPPLNNDIAVKSVQLAIDTSHHRIASDLDLKAILRLVATSDHATTQEAVEIEMPLSDLLVAINITQKAC